ncbi:hypothetical protein F4782DRAFT_492484 [Xylaria castorea]|nr:hypothetical protein F4782DRAFT_492484 [Xylaria castorea]
MASCASRPGLLAWLLATCQVEMGVDELALGVVGSWIPPVSRDHPVLGVGCGKGVSKLAWLGRLAPP